MMIRIIEEIREQIDVAEMDILRNAINKYLTPCIDIRDNITVGRSDGIEYEIALESVIKSVVMLHLVHNAHARNVVLQEFDNLGESGYSYIKAYIPSLKVWQQNFTAEETVALIKLHAVLHNDSNNKTLERIMKKAFSKLVRIADNMKSISALSFDVAYSKHTEMLEFEFSTAIYYRFLKGKYLVELDNVFEDIYVPVILEAQRTLNTARTSLYQWKESEEVKFIEVYTADLTKWICDEIREVNLPKSIEVNHLIGKIENSKVLFTRFDLLKAHFKNVKISSDELLDIYYDFKFADKEATYEQFSTYLMTYFIEKYHADQQAFLYDYVGTSLSQTSDNNSDKQIQGLIATREGEITQLENKISRMEKAHNEKLEQAAREYQALERKYKDLQKEIEDTTNLKREIQIHRSSLYEQLIEVDTDETIAVDQTDYIQLLKDMDVTFAFFGGYPSFRQRWKETFGDKVRLVGVRDYYVDLKFINNVDVIIFDGKFNNHSLFENVMAALTSDEPVFKLLRTGRSMQLICKDIYQKLTNSNK